MSFTPPGGSVWGDHIHCFPVAESSPSAMAWRRLVVSKDMDWLPVGLAPTTAAAPVLLLFGVRGIDVVE